MVSGHHSNSDLPTQKTGKQSLEEKTEPNEIQKNILTPQRKHGYLHSFSHIFGRSINW